jgi:hypothetical protein
MQLVMVLRPLKVHRPHGCVLLGGHVQHCATRWCCGCARRQHYSAERMSLVVLGGEDLDTQEQRVRALFGALPNGRGPRPSFKEAGMPYKVSCCAFVVVLGTLLRGVLLLGALLLSALVLGRWYSKSWYLARRYAR